jgi:threonine dehydratase
VNLPVDIRRIERAAERLAGRVAATPLQASHALGLATSVPVYLKMETRQHTGSFKLRGATNAMLSLRAGARANGVVTASTGNHGRALAEAARNAGVRAVVCMSALVAPNKVEAVRALGAEIRIVGRSQDDAQVEVDRLRRDEGLAEIPPFDHPDVIAGQGTVGLEIIRQAPQVATVLVPLSGGGLAAGVAAAVKGVKPDARVIGVSMRRGAAMHASLGAGRPVAVEEVETLADSLGGGVGLENRYSFAMCRALLDDVILVEEDEIAAAIRHLFEVEQEVVEGAGAVGVAALLAGKVATEGPIVALLSGRNIAPELHRAIVTGRYAARAVA